jgi:hypothetical protein
MTSFLGIGVELAKSNRSLRTDQIFILYSMFLLENSRFCKELLIEMYNKVGDLNLYVVNECFHLNVFSTQVRVSPYIPKRGRDMCAVVLNYSTHAIKITNGPDALTLFRRSRCNKR